MYLIYEDMSVKLSCMAGQKFKLAARILSGVRYFPQMFILGDVLRVK